MIRVVRLSFASLILSTGATALWSQTPLATDIAPAPVLVIQREVLKPGKSGMLHEKSESAYVKSMQAANWPVHYLAMDSVSGPYRSLFLLGYPSFAAWEKDVLDQAKNARLSAEMAHEAIVDGELLSSSDQTVWDYRKDLSYGDPVDLATMRYLDITEFHVKPGRSHEFEELVKLYQKAYANVPNARWTLYENSYGPSTTYLVFVPWKNLAEVDKSFDDSKLVDAALGPEGKKHLAELTAACIESTEDNLFHFNPTMSYTSERWIQVDPGFWRPKPPAASKPTSPAAKTP